MVLRAIKAMMVYSNGGDTTNSHMRYWKVCLFCGIWRVSGLALMAKSMQALCKQNRYNVLITIWIPPYKWHILYVSTMHDKWAELIFGPNFWVIINLEFLMGLSKKFGSNPFQTFWFLRSSQDMEEDCSTSLTSFFSRL